MTSPSTPMTPAAAAVAYLDWFVQHIPHRIRSALAGTDLLVTELHKLFDPRTVRTAGIEAHIKTKPDSVALLCCGNAIWEGRLSSTRWLIDFLGISCNKHRQPIRPTPHDHDWRIHELGCELFPLVGTQAQRLADVWLGCTKATSHPTRNSNHPDVGPKDLNEAAQIIIPYIETKLYAPAGRNLIRDTMLLHSGDAPIALPVAK